MLGFLQALMLASAACRGTCDGPAALAISMTLPPDASPTSESVCAEPSTCRNAQHA
jgi:hypothetical protein